MRHPKDRSDGLTRRQLLRGAAGAAAGIGAAGALAACQNTTTPIGFCEDGGEGRRRRRSGLARSSSSRSPSARAACRCRARTTASRGRSPTTTRRSRTACSSRSGTLRLFNYADYIDPGLLKRFREQFDRKVEVGTYNSSDEAVAKLSRAQVDFDVLVGLSGSVIVQLMAKQLLQPLNHSYLPNLEANVWPQLQDPFYDRGARYTVPYVLWQDGIGWRNDKIDVDIAAMDVPWDIFWDSGEWRGKVGLLDDKRDALSMPMQRDAMARGAIADVNTEDPEIIAKAGQDLQQLTELSNIKVTITDYQTLPEGKSWLHHSWSGDLLAAVIYYLPEGTPPDALSFWGPPSGGVVQNDFLCITRATDRPALAHTFLNFMLDEKNAYDNFVELQRLRPAPERDHAESLIDSGLIPDTLDSAVIRPEQFPVNDQLLALTVEGERLWENAWSEFKAG